MLRTLAFLAALSLALPASAGETTITIKSFMFNPMNATVAAGDTVTWKNLDEEPHTVASSEGLFRSGGLDTNATFSFHFDKPGTYKYTCSIHPQMTGIVTVK